MEDVENIDPILNSVLNKEVTKTGGRVMVTLGDKEIDFSPTFVIFMSTRDPTAFFTPDLCSRVTFVNFTVTPSSLTTQCLSKVLKAEQPKVDEKRSDILKLQGEFRVRLRNLEDSLLAALSAVKGERCLLSRAVVVLHTLNPILLLCPSLVQATFWTTRTSWPRWRSSSPRPRRSPPR